MTSSYILVSVLSDTLLTNSDITRRESFIVAYIHNLFEKNRKLIVVIFKV